MIKKNFARKTVMTLSAILTVMMLCFAGIISIGETAEAASSDYVLPEVLKWINEKADTGWNEDVDGFSGVQCVDLIKAYYQFLGYDYVAGNANEYATDDKFLQDGWYRDNIPSPGSIVAWPENVETGKGGSATGIYGHVAIVVEVDGEKVYTVETNYNGISAAQKVEREPENAIYIHPNFNRDSRAIIKWAIKVPKQIIQEKTS